MSPIGGSASSTGWKWNAGTILLVIALGGTVLGAFLPWATIGIFSVSGIDRDGAITLTLGILGGVLGILGVVQARRGMIIAALVAMVLITLVSGYDSIDVLSASDDTFGITVSIGSGLILTVIGGICGIIGSTILLKDGDQPV